MGVRFECKSRVDAPIAKVFDLAMSIDAHLDSMARHHERAIAGVTRGQIGLGEVVTWHARHFGVPWTMTSRIVELDRPTSFADEQVKGPFARYRHEHRFISVDGGTETLDVVSLEVPFGLLGRIAERILRPHLHRLIEARNAHLKRAAERAS